MYPGGSDDFLPLALLHQMYTEAVTAAATAANNLEESEVFLDNGIIHAVACDIFLPSIVQKNDLFRPKLPWHRSGGRVNISTSCKDSAALFASSQPSPASVA